MAYRTLSACVADLRRMNQLVDFDEPVDPYLELAAVQRRLFAAAGPAVLFTKPYSTKPYSTKLCSTTKLTSPSQKFSPFPMLANLYGTENRLRIIFRDGIEHLKNAITLGSDPLDLLGKLSFKNCFTQGLSALQTLRLSRPKKVSARFAPVLKYPTTLDRLPQLVSWPDDGGPYITLPLVYTEHPNCPGFAASNLGMYRVQIAGNDYVQNQEVGLHYQIQRGIALHHAAALSRNENLRVNIFIGGTPAMTLAAIMPMPEHVSELLFAGILGQHRIPMVANPKNGGLPIYAEADFCVTGTLSRKLKPEGPFGDHLGYYSLSHEFPILKVDGVWHRKDAIWPFTVVGRPPQEDTMFGKLIHELTGSAVTKKLPGIREVHAVDEAGVHPLLLAIGREQYEPFRTKKRAAELHTLAHSLLGFGQLSLAKYLFLAAEEDDPRISVQNVRSFLTHILRRVDWKHDVHFVTETTADTLDYSSYENDNQSLNRGSKMFVAVSGSVIRELGTELPANFPAQNPRMAMPGVVCVTKIDGKRLRPEDVEDEFPLIVLVDDSEKATASLPDFLWTTFTKSDPARDVHGIGEFTDKKHWGCRGSLVIDARVKKHHAPELVEPANIARKADRIVNQILDKHAALKNG